MDIKDLKCYYWRLYRCYLDSNFSCRKIQFAINSIRIAHPEFHDTEEQSLLNEVEARQHEKIECTGICEVCDDVIRSFSGYQNQFKTGFGE